MTKEALFKGWLALAVIAAVAIGIVLMAEAG